MRGSFFDSNVLLYLASADAVKAERAELLVREGGAISVQVLNEIANVARRKMRLPWRETHHLLATIRQLLTVLPIAVETHELALELAERYGLAVYDALIVAAALLAGCDKLWSEDMQDGMVIDKQLRIVNPFGDRAR
jgi:predicted nucleic acid-binding protein